MVACELSRYAKIGDLGNLSHIVQYKRAMLFHIIAISRPLICLAYAQQLKREIVATLAELIESFTYKRKKLQAEGIEVSRKALYELLRKLKTTGPVARKQRAKRPST